MGVASDPAFSPGEKWARRLRDLEKKVERIAAERNLESATIGAGGLRIKAGGKILIEDGLGGVVDITTLAFGLRAATITAEEGTSSNTYTDLATPGPEVTTLIGSSRRAIVLISVSMNAFSGDLGAVTARVSGASDIQGLGDSAAFVRTNTGTEVGNSATSFAYVDASKGLNEGLNTFKLFYASTGADTVLFKDRKIAVFPF